MNPDLRNLFMKWLTRDRVVPIISASVSWLIFAMRGSGRPSLPKLANSSSSRASRWSLAPIEMAWEGKSITEICTQIKDPARSGRDLTQLQEHFARNDLVAWAWNPGLGRDPVPGTQERLGELIKAWIDTGA